jgi:predicted MFS family arabinose efflux permease
MSADPKLETSEPPVASLPEAPYSAFNNWQKRCIVILMAAVGCLGTLSSFIYFPAIPELANSLDVSVGNINLTITVYLIVAAVAPTIVANSADTIGRRPTVVACLGIYLGANIGLALSPSFAVLMCCRVIQAAGISGTFAVTFGVLGDLFTPMERGNVSGIMSFVLNTPPSFGPVLSGLLMQRWGWRSIFWFLTATSACFLLIIVLCLPETSRSVIGSGSMRATYRVHRPLFSALLPEYTTDELESTNATGNEKPGRISNPNPFKTLIILRNPASLLVICAMAIYYAIYSSLQASLSSLLGSTYKTSSLVTGLAYLPFGIGCGLGAVLSGEIPRGVLVLLS